MTMLEKLIQEDKRGFEIQAFERIFFCQELKIKDEFCFSLFRSRYNKNRAFFFSNLVKGLFKSRKKDLDFHLDFMNVFLEDCFVTDKYRILV
jgi:hypothetical protein